MTFALPKSLPAGSWRVTVRLVSGMTTCTATATIQFAPVVAARTGLSEMAWIGIALGVFVLALAVVMVRYVVQHRTTTA
jgi:hypothetical protein